MRTILIIDDVAQSSALLETALTNMGYSPVVVRSAEEALKNLQKYEIHLILSEARLPGLSARELLKKAYELAPLTPVVIMTADATLKEVVEVIKGGAFDCIAKPFDPDILKASVAKALRSYAENAENDSLRKALDRTFVSDDLIGKSPAIQEVRLKIHEVSASLANVLITGESGTGKEVVAKAIHTNGPRASFPFVTINCAAIPETLLESELFGHVKGAFTGATSNRQGRFAQADKGTIFLDEIGDMPLALQPKILRCIQAKTIDPVGAHMSLKVDVRIIAATHHGLAEAVGCGTFRRDLYYRLNVYPIVVPPLRERREDIPGLTAHFAKQYAAKTGGQPITFTEAGMRAMWDYPWPGNIRELENCVERLSIIAPGYKITPHTLATCAIFPDARKGTANFFAPSAAQWRLPLDLKRLLEDLERELITQALEETGGMQNKAAGLLRIAESSIRHRIKKFRITARKAVANVFTPGAASGRAIFPLDLDHRLRALERELIMQALEEAGGVQVKAAELLRISEYSIWYRIKRLGITVVHKRTAFIR